MTGKMVNQHGKIIKPFGLGVDVMQLNDLLQAAGIGLDELGLCQFGCLPQRVCSCLRLSISGICSRSLAGAP